MNLHFKVFGQGEPLIILHGLLGSLDNWQTLAKKYAAHFTVFIIDLRNHGKSPHSTDFSYDLMTQDIYNFCEQNHIYSTNVLGHSMGGKVAMQFALENEDMVNKLIVADIAPVVYKAHHQQIFEALLSVDLSKAKERDDVEEILSKYIDEKSVVQFLMKGLTRNTDLQFEWKFNVQALWNNYNKILDVFKTNKTFYKPCLFLKGEYSKYILPQYEKDIYQYFPHAKVEQINKAGHWLHAENPTDFFDKSMQFLL